jgi:hypothetical protein
VQKIKICSVFLVLLLVTGCYTSYTRRLDTPILRPTPQQRIVSFKAGEQSASIGDELFRVTRHLVGEYEVVRFKAPTPEPFPLNAMWTGTHVYNDQKSGDLIVFTTPAYYDGQIGVILDERGMAATQEPLVQLDGAKKGKTWRLNGKGKFFDESSRFTERWMLRYGGKIGDQYIFEIVKDPESSTSAILQSIKISEPSFFEGFTVRDVFIKGLSGDTKGVIRYSVVDTLSSNR